MRGRLNAALGVIALASASFITMTAASAAPPTGSPSGEHGPFVGDPVSSAGTSDTLADIARSHPAPKPGRTKTTTTEGLGVGSDVVPAVTAPDGAVQLTETVGDAPQELTTPLVGFAGQTSTFSPTDSVGDVGDDQYVQMINSTIAVYDKQGNVLSAATNINNLWINGVAAGQGQDQCRNQNAGDPIVLYDQQADRWMVSQFTNPNSATGPGGTFPMCIAYSQTDDATGNWWLYQFNLPASHDYMKYGIWPDGLYMSTFEGSNLGAYVFDRAAMIGGSPATFQYFQIGAGTGVDGRANRILPADWDGDNPPPAGSPNPFAMSFDDAFDGGNDRIVIRDFHVDWTNPANSTFDVAATLNTVPFDTDLGCTGSPARNCIPQPGTTQRVDALSNRMMHRLQYRNLGDHQAMVVSQTVDAGGDRAGVRWYELRNTGSGWSVFQQSTYAPNDGIHRWMPSAAMDKAGNIALGYSVSDGTSTFPGLRYTARLAGQALGAMGQGEQTLVSGTTAQTFGARWGDYSALTVDPADDCTFWYTGQYNGNSNTWIGSFRLPSCSATDLAVTKTADPMVVAAGTPVTFTVAIANNGPNTAEDVTVTDTMPAGITASGVSATAGGTCAGTATITCTWPSLLAGASATVTIQATVPAGAVGNTATNTATASMANQTDSNPANDTGAVTVSIVRSADLAVTKQCKPDESTPAGTAGSCQIYVDNLGPSNASNVTLTDALYANAPFSVTSVTTSAGSCSPTSTGPVTSSTVSCTLGTLAPAGRVTIDIAVTSDVSTDVNDTATVASATADPNPDNNVSTGSVRFAASADLVVTKVDLTDPVTAGTQASWQVSVANDGPSAAASVVVTDYLPAALLDGTVSANPSVGSCTVGTPGDASKPTICNLGTLAAGASATVLISGTVDPSALGPMTNDAVASSATADPDNGNNRATTDTLVVASADVSLTKADSPDPVTAGNQLTYSLTVTNAGPSVARDVQITDDLPGFVTLARADAGCTLVQASQVVCSVGDLAPGASATVRLDVLVAASTPSGSVLENQAVASSGTADPVPGNNTASATTQVVTSADLWLDKQGVLRTGNPSTVLTYTLVVHNDSGCETDDQSSPTPTCGSGGPSDAQNVVVYDKLPLDPKKLVVQYVSPSCAYTKASHDVTCSVGTIPAGASVSFVIEAQVNGSVGNILNLASIQSSDTPDPVAGNNTDTVSVTVKGGTGKRK